MTESTHNVSPDWYERRNELSEGQIFMTHEGHKVRLDRRVPGDGSKWYVDDWNSHRGNWSCEDGAIEPGDLCGNPL